MHVDNLNVDSEVPKTSHRLAMLTGTEAIIYRSYLLFKDNNYDYCGKAAETIGIDPDQLFPIKALFDDYIGTPNIDQDRTQAVANILGMTVEELQEIKDSLTLENLGHSKISILNRILELNVILPDDQTNLGLSQCKIDELVQVYDSRKNNPAYSMEQLILDPISLVLLPNKEDIQPVRYQHLNTYDYLSPEDGRVTFDHNTSRSIMSHLDLTTNTQNLDEVGRVAKFIYMTSMIYVHATAAFGGQYVRPGVETYQGDRVEEIISAEIARKFLHYLGIEFNKPDLQERFIELFKYNNLSDALVILKLLSADDHSQLRLKFLKEGGLWREGIISALYDTSNPLPDIVVKPVCRIISLFIRCIEEYKPTQQEV